MKKLILLLSLTLTACYTRFEPEGDFLPAAKVGQPYYQRIYLYNSIPRTIWIEIYPEDKDNNGLNYRFIDSHSDKESSTNSGNIIEISGMPKANDISKISVVIQGYGYQGSRDDKQRFQKIYTIKLIPDKNHSRKPVKKPDVPNCTAAYDKEKHQLCI